MRNMLFVLIVSKPYKIIYIIKAFIDIFEFCSKYSLIDLGVEISYERNRKMINFLNFC